jgi:hypothetical protein
MRGFSISSAVKPSALKRLLWGACAVPTFTESLFISISFYLKNIYEII